MSSNLPVIAGTISTLIFAASTMPMLVKAARTRDLSSYSGGNLVLSNVGNVLYAIYVFSMPAGPAWALYAFNLTVSATMLGYWLRYRRAPGSFSRRTSMLRCRLRDRAIASAVFFAHGNLTLAPHLQFATDRGYRDPRASSTTAHPLAFRRRRRPQRKARLRPEMRA